MRLIDADALKDALDYIDYGQHQYDLTMEAIDSAPTIEDRKDGVWIRHENPNLGRCMKVQYECSVCKVWIGCEYFVRRSFCPNCGSKMKGEVDGKND